MTSIDRGRSDPGDKPGAVMTSTRTGDVTWQDHTYTPCLAEPATSRKRGISATSSSKQGGVPPIFKPQTLKIASQEEETSPVVQTLPPFKSFLTPRLEQDRISLVLNKRRPEEATEQQNGAQEKRHRTEQPTLSSRTKERPQNEEPKWDGVSTKRPDSATLFPLNPQTSVAPYPSVLHPQTSVAPYPSVLKPKTSVTPCSSVLKPKTSVTPYPSVLHPQTSVAPYPSVLKPKTSVTPYPSVLLPQTSVTPYL